jgi:hypothetical protein
MKYLLSTMLVIFSAIAHAQQDKVADLPSGTYVVKQAGNFTYGNIILLDGSRYKLTNGGEGGDCRFSATAQRILFMSGVLKGAFAKTIVVDGDAAIVLPKKENEDIGLKLADADVLAVHRKQ